MKLEKAGGRVAQRGSTGRSRASAQQSTTASKEEKKKTSAKTGLDKIRVVM